MFFGVQDTIKTQHESFALPVFPIFPETNSWRMAFPIKCPADCLSVPFHTFTYSKTWEVNYKYHH